nr:protein FAR1-related sequence 11 [Tanacetum cinerariifolium]
SAREKWDVEDGPEWHVTKFIKDHNHELLSHEEMRFPPANRIITPEDEQEILLSKEAGLNIREIIQVVELKKNVKLGEFRLVSKYGDVVVFDTTYKVNVYDMPCALFVGVNNHGKTVLFGSALFRNETLHTFRWLMKVDLAIEIKKAEVHSKMLSKLRHPSLKTKSPLEEQAFEVLTPLAFKKFQEEFERANNLQRSAKDNEISIDETSKNHEDILLDDMEDAENDILCPLKSIPKGRPRKGRE